MNRSSSLFDELADDADVDRLNVFVPLIMSAGLVLSAMTLARDAIHRWRRHGHGHAVAVGDVVAAATLTGAPSRQLVAATLKSRRFYFTVALAGLGTSAYIVIGATGNYLRPSGYVSHIAWLWALSVVVAALLAFVGGLSLAVAVTWPRPPRWTEQFVTMIAWARTGADDGTGPSRALGWTLAALAASTVLLTLVVVQSPHLLSGADRAISEQLREWPLAWMNDLDVLGRTEVAVGLALLVGISTLRCPIFALSYLFAVGAGLAASSLFRLAAHRPRPGGGPLAALVDSYPSGHVVQAVLIAGFLPIAAWVLVRRRWAVVAAIAVAGLALPVTGVARIRGATHWPADVVGGALLGATIVASSLWVLQHRRWHTQCSSCPWTLHERGASGRAMGLVQLPESTANGLARAARMWTLGAITGFLLLLRTTGLPTHPEGDTLGGQVTEPVQLILLGLVVVAWLLSGRFRAAAATLLGLAGLGLGVVAAVEYRPLVSVLVTAAFVVPAVALWAAWQHRRALRTVVVLALVATALLTGAWMAGSATYDYFYGPAHPASPLHARSVDRVSWVWTGGVTAHGATIVAKVEGDRTTSLDLRTTDGAEVGSVRGRRVPGTDIHRWTVTGLRPATSHRYRIVVDHRADRSRGRGWFRTFPATDASFTVAFGACARTGSNGAVYDTIRRLDPDLYVATGDLHYGNLSSTDPDAFLRMYDRVLTAPAQAELYRRVPVAYVWDDHDYGPNDADASSPTRAAAREAYRAAAPHAPLPAGDGGAIYQAFSLGTTRFILTDTRSERTGSTMLGREQLAWLERELVNASGTHELVVWVNPDPWIAPAEPSRDDWGGYADERKEIADVLARAKVDNLVMVSGDAHMVAIDDGTNSGYASAGGGGFPVLHAAALDRRGNVKGGPYSEGAFPGAGQFGTLTVDQSGPEMTVTLRGITWEGRVLTSYSFSVPG